jgi:outer membrane receptor protein involved in Fe transport
MQLTASYSRRVDRPELSQFNPFRVYATPLSFSQGNPRLRPAITDSYEAAFEYGEKSVYYLATLYYRDTHGLVSPVTENLGDGVLLGTYDNIGHSRNAGAELVANGPITKTLSYSVTTDAFWNELTDPDAPNGPPHSGAVFTFEPKLKWDVTPNDFVQLNVYASTRAPTAQGYTSGYVYSDIGYRHRFSDRLSLVAQWLDPTNGLRFTTVTDTLTLKQRSDSHYLGNFLSLGLTYDLGGVPKSAPKEIDFGGAAPTH